MSIDHGEPWRPGPVDLVVDIAEIRRRLARLTFPALKDDILAALVRQHAPARLLWRVGGVSRTRRYGSLDEVLADLAGPRTPGGPPPPGW